VSDNRSASPDREARTREFVRLLTAHEQEINGYILSLIPNWADAEEAMQETKLRLWEQFDEYDPTRSFGGWALTIARFMVLTYRKQSQRAAARFSQQFVDSVSRQAELMAPHAYSIRQALSDCVAKLSQGAQELLRACYGERESIAEIAVRLGRSVRGTQRALAQTRIELQHCIENAMRKEESR
jgi:RNA polymerase sigma-70 factor (ECF subfamily)